MDITVRQLTAGDEATACRVAQWLKGADMPSDQAAACTQGYPPRLRWHVAAPAPRAVLALQRASRHIDPERTTVDYLPSHSMRGRKA